MSERASAGSLQHYFEWQPQIDHSEYTIDLRPLDGHWGEAGFAFACIIGRAEGGAEQIPKFSASYWSNSPIEAQYHAFKQAAYLLTFGTLPQPIEAGAVSGVEDKVLGREMFVLRPVE